MLKKLLCFLIVMLLAVLPALAETSELIVYNPQVLSQADRTCDQWYSDNREQTLFSVSVLCDIYEFDKAGTLSDIWLSAMSQDHIYVCLTDAGLNIFFFGTQSTMMVEYTSMHEPLVITQQKAASDPVKFLENAIGEGRISSYAHVPTSEIILVLMLSAEEETE